MKVLAFGEVLWDIYPDKEFIGGAPFNFAAHAAKHGEEVCLLSSVGNDDLGSRTLKCVESFGIDTKHVLRLSNKETGKCVVTLNEHSVPSYDLFDDVAYDYISCNSVCEKYDVLYFGTLALRSEYNFESISKLVLNNNFNEIFVDINIRPPHFSNKSVEFAFNNATIIKISDEELPTVCKSLNMSYNNDYANFAKDFSNKYTNLKCIIISLGDKGAYAFDCDKKQEFFSESENADVISTVGAGDSFSAAFLSMYFKNKSIPECIKHANKIAAFVVSNYDAVPNYNVKDFI